MPAFFVTGTGTEVGKTMVTAALAHQLCARGDKPVVLKPVLSGFAVEEVAQTDAGVLLAACDRPVDIASLNEVSPWRFAAPLSPDMSAAREGRSIDFAELVAYCRRAIDVAPDVTLIEGIGGAMVPLDKCHTVLDWIAALDLPVLLVAGSYLGTLSHTLTTLQALAAWSVAVQALVISESLESPVPISETIETLERHAPNLRIVGMPRITGDEPWRRAADLTELLS